MPFRTQPTVEPRGLSWSDFAVLFRSVAKDADPLVAEMRRRDIPYVVKGLNRLFDSPEIPAVVGVFRYMAGLIEAPTCAVCGTTRTFSPANGDWAAALAVLEEGRDFDRGERWGVYNIQRLYLEFLEALGLREETVPGDPVRRELVFYQLGQVQPGDLGLRGRSTSTPTPRQKYEAFAAWLEYQAPGYYAESDADVGYATPDAVTLTTVHQAKGMQWPAVFLPCLRENRFPAKRQGGLGLFHVIPEIAIADADRYRGTVDDETRLFYVAVTGAEVPVRVVLARAEPALHEAVASSSTTARAQQWFSTRDPGVPADAPRLEPRARHETPNVTLSFSELKYLFECPYQFKLRFLYGFNPPLHEALGYGKGLHDALAEMHKRAITGDIASHERGRGPRHPASAHPVRVPRAEGDAARAPRVQSVQRYLEGA